MNFAALLILLLGATTRTSTLVDDVYNVGPGRMRYLDIAMPAYPVRVLCAFEVESGETGIRARLVGRDQSVVAETQVTLHGGLSTRPPVAGHYRLVLDNSHNRRSAAKVALYVRLVYGEGPVGPVRKADPAKGRVLVLSSMALAAGVALFAGVRIKRNLERNSFN
jgi:hypothetical protein